MRLFRVENEWKDDHLTPDKCVHVVRDEAHTPAVPVGDGWVPVSKSLAEPFEHTVPLAQLPLLAANFAKDEPKRLVRPSRAEVARIREGRYYGPALVHVAVPAYPGGRVSLRATSFGERVAEGRFCAHVEREYLPITDAGGICIHYITDDEEEALIEMLPGSAFRVEHDEPFVPPEESPVLVISWNGKELRCFRPQKFKDRAKNKRYHRPRNA
jgi:hypothetical protein